MSVLRRVGAAKIVLLVSLLQTITMTVAAADTTTTSTVVLGYGSLGWSYRQVAYDNQPGFEAPSFDVAAWTVGQAGFGTTDGTCPWNNSNQVKTNWDPGTDLLLRHHFAVPDSVAAIHIEGTVDNNADVYVNGSLVQHVDNGFCTPGGIDIDVPASTLADDNVLAIRARDLGSASFIDVQVTYPDSPLPQADSPVCQRSGPGGTTDGWAYSAVMSASEGLVIKDLRFGPRLVARMISVPYIKPVGFGLDSNDRPTIGHLTVTPDNRDPDLRTTLTGVRCDDPPHSGVSATYRVTSQSTGLTFVVQQSYRFDSFDGDETCEPTEMAKCVRFWPTFTWALPGATTPSADVGLAAVQRFAFDPDGVGADPDPVGGSADVIADVLNLGELGVEDLAGNGRLRREGMIRAIHRGETVHWESYHQTRRNRVGLPGHPGPGGTPGCSECVHAHWSWFSHFTDLSNIATCGSRNCWTDGKPQILDGSQQDALAGWVTDTDQQPTDWQALASDETSIPADVRPVFYWEGISTVSASPGAGVSIDGVDYAYGDSYWPQLDNKRHGGNGSTFIVPARRFQTVSSRPKYPSEASVTPLYWAVTRSFPGTRLPVGWVLPVKISVGNDSDQGPYYLRVKSNGPRLLNAAPLYSPASGGAPWVLIYNDTLTANGRDWKLASPDSPPLQEYNSKQGYMLALVVFDQQPTAANTSFQLNAAPNGVGGYLPTTGDW